MADKRCKNGHFIDESWDICPYCPPPEASTEDEPKISVVKPKSKRPEPEPEPRPEPEPQSDPDPTPTPAKRRSEAPQRRSEAPPPPPPVERTVSVAKAEVSSHVDPSARYAVGWLVSLNGVGRGESFTVRLGRNVIGRDRKSDIYVNDEQASAHHADLVYRPDEGRFIIMDHNSTNGTYVNDTEIEPRRDLVNNDIVSIGKHRFMFIALCGENFTWDDRENES